MISEKLGQPLVDWALIQLNSKSFNQSQIIQNSVDFKIKRFPFCYLCEMENKACKYYLPEKVGSSNIDLLLK